MGLIVAEIRKLTTMRTTWVVTLLGIVLVAVSATFAVFLDLFGGAFTGTDEQVALVIGQIVGNSAIVLVVAILAVTTEFRHGTIGRTLQLVPSRTRVLAAKLVAGVGYAIAFFAAGMVVVALFVLLGADELQVGSAALDALWQGATALVLTAILGSAVGALLRSQVVAVIVALVWVFAIEPPLAFFLPRVGRWLPFQLLSALSTTEEMTAGPDGMAMAQPVEAAVALPLFFGYVAVATIAAGLLMRYRDV